METLASLATTFIAQLQKPNLAFLIGGMVLAALGSRFRVPEQIYKFIVIILLLKVGMSAGISVRSANPMDLALPALFAAIAGVLIVIGGSFFLRLFHGVSSTDAYATAGLFGAVSASTLAAGMAMLEAEDIAYEGFIGALYPFMDIAALLTAILFGRLALMRKSDTPVIAMGASTVGAVHLSPIQARTSGADLARHIIADTLRSPAISALLLGLALGILARTDVVYASFYEQLFPGFLSILMLIMGMEAWERIGELRRVAHAYFLYAITAPFVHGAIGFGAGLIAHHWTGFSPGGVVLLAVMAASSSDISGPPTLRASLPEANASTYLGASTGIGTPIAILSIPLWIALADHFIGG